MKKILIFSLAYYPSHVSGAEVAIKEITDRISLSDIEFHMLTLLFDMKAPRYEKIGNVHVHRVGFGGEYLSKILFVPLAAITARSLHNKLRFDGAWAMMTYQLWPLVLARFIGVRVPYALTLQDGDPYSKVFGRWFVRPLVPLLDYGFRHATVVQAISDYLAEWAPKRGHTGTVVVIPNGASTESLREYPEAELDLLRQTLNITRTQKVLLTVGRLVHQKAQDMVIRALPLLPAHIRYVLVGEGEDRPMLKSLAAELGVMDRVSFTGYVDRTMTAKYRKIADIFILPSRSEGQGISFLSTMVSGLPLIATQVGGIADFLFDAQRNPDRLTTGWAVDVDSPTQIAEAVQEILADPLHAAEVAQNAKGVALQRYSWDAIVSDMKTKVFDPVLHS